MSARVDPEIALKSLRRLRVALGILLMAASVVLVPLTGIGMVNALETCEANKPERRAEHQLGSGAACGEISSDVMPCVLNGIEYRCIRGRNNLIACAAKHR